ncbi:MAG: hypothetical protein ACREPX_09710 [Rhodanobacteraceae bacterium]
MLKILTGVLAGLVLLAPMSVFAADPAQGSTTADTAHAPDTDKALAKYREAMQAQRSDIMAKGMTLSADQAAKFWPLYEQYQKEQNVIIDKQIDAVQNYAANYQTLDDKQAIAYVTALLDRDSKMEALRMKWLGKFQQAVPGGIAARAIQIDRRISQIAQAELSAQVPLVH